MVGVAVYVNVEPEQIAIADAAMLTLAAKGVATVIVIVFDVAVVADTQNAFEVMVQVIVLPAVKVLVEYVGALVPTIVPFFLH